MEIIRNFIKIILGWIALIVGLLGWMIPIPLIPFFLLFFIGVHMLGYDIKLIRLFKKMGLDTIKLEKNLEKINKDKNEK